MNICGVKIVYLSMGVDFKGLLKFVYYDLNLVVIFEYKGLYWLKMKGIEVVKIIMFDEDYVIFFGKVWVVLQVDLEQIVVGDFLVVIIYGMGVYWVLNVAKVYFG